MQPTVTAGRRTTACMLPQLPSFSCWRPLWAEANKGPAAKVETQCAESQPQHRKRENTGAGLEPRDNSLKACTIEEIQGKQTYQVTCPEVDEVPPAF